MTRGLALWLITLALVACDEGKDKASPLATATASAGPVDPNVAYARELTVHFGKAVKAALVKGISSGGPAKAVAVCNVEAPEIAKTIKMKDGWSIRRTSAKLRNPADAPDEWERAVLERFEKQHAAGKTPEQLEEHAIVEADGAKTFRYMKAIGTTPVCLTCHGGDLDADVVEALDKRYPKDQARGFEVGDIRGAFSIKKSL